VHATSSKALMSFLGFLVQCDISSLDHRREERRYTARRLRVCGLSTGDFAMEVFAV
jgi:hypothetical protein